MAGTSFTYFYNAINTPKTVMSLGTRLGYSEVKSYNKSTTTIEQDFDTGDELSSREYWFSRYEKSRNAVIGVVAQFEYKVDDYLSFGLRYSLNHRKT